MSGQEKLNVNIKCRNPSQTANYIIKEAMVDKANGTFLKVLLLGILAGAFIGFGGEIFAVAAHDGVNFAGFGATRILAGAVFSLGLILVVIAGADLFTGNTLIAGSVLEGKITVSKLLKNWGLVYCANFIGAVLLAFMAFYSNTWQENGSLVGTYTLKIGVTKVNLTIVEILIRGILCNWLVCLAVWMSYAAKNIVGKIFAIMFPIMTFVAIGYEHCIANIFFITKAMLLSTQPTVVTLAQLSPEKLANLNLVGFGRNLFWATTGNIIGSLIFIVGFYWTAYVAKNDCSMIDHTE